MSFTPTNTNPLNLPEGAFNPFGREITFTGIENGVELYTAWDETYSYALVENATAQEAYDAHLSYAETLG